MNVAIKLGLEEEVFCKMVLTTKMLLSNVLGHAAELHYEKLLTQKGILFQKAPTDEHFDYIVNEERHQVKRFESSSTNLRWVGANLTMTHGDRHGPDAFYRRNSFDKLILFDVGFQDYHEITIETIPQNPNYPDRLPGKFRISRSTPLNDSNREFLDVMKITNRTFKEAMEALRTEKHLNYSAMLEHVCGLSLSEIDSLFSVDNFRLVTGAKGFAAEEHFNQLLEAASISYVQNPDMYSKIDHWVGGDVRVQVKIPNLRSTNDESWGVKMHKSHGHGELELCGVNEFDVLALFVGFEMDESIDRYFPTNVTRSFIFVPAAELERHPDYPNYFKRIVKIQKNGRIVNDLSIFS